MPKKTAPIETISRNGTHSELVPPKAPERKSGGQIIIQKFDFPTVPVKIIGTAPLHVNCFPAKLRQEMAEKRGIASDVQSPSAGGSKGKRVNRPARDFKQEYLDSLYPLDGGGYGFPAIAFKKAMVGACRQTTMDMTLANRIIFVKRPYESRGFGCVKIIGEPRMIEVVVRLAGMDRPPDLRYLGEFFPWSAILEIEFNAAMISVEGIYNLLQYAGKCEGVGEQRPSSRKSAGDFGTFRLAEGKE
jgi:hypothetical protein